MFSIIPGPLGASPTFAPRLLPVPPPNREDSCSPLAVV